MAVLTAAPAPADTIRLVTGNNYAPYTDENLPEGGFATDVVRRVLQSMGHEVVVDFGTWSRAKELTARAEYYATFPWTYTEERAKDFAFSMPFVVQKQFALFDKNRVPAARDIQGLKGLVLCSPFIVALPHTLVPFLDSGEMHIERPDNEVLCLKMIQRGRADFYVTSRDLGAALIENAGIPASEFTWSSFPVIIQKSGLMAAKDNQAAVDLLPEFDKALKAFKASGEYVELAKKHGIIID